MKTTLDPKDNPAVQLAKANAATQFPILKRVLASGTFRSSIGTFPAARVAAEFSGGPQRRR